MLILYIKLKLFKINLDLTVKHPIKCMNVNRNTASAKSTTAVVQINNYRVQTTDVTMYSVHDTFFHRC